MADAATHVLGLASAVLGRGRHIVALSLARALHTLVAGRMLAVAFELALAARNARQLRAHTRHLGGWRLEVQHASGVVSHSKLLSEWNGSRRD